MVEEMGLSGVVEIRLNVSFQQLKELLQQTSVGLHTMWNEHFGIGVLLFLLLLLLCMFFVFVVFVVVIFYVFCCWAGLLFGTGAGLCFC